MITNPNKCKIINIKHKGNSIPYYCVSRLYCKKKVNKKNFGLS